MTDANHSVLRQRAARLAAAPSAAPLAPLELIAFTILGAQYAVTLESVRAVLREAVTPMPGVAAWIAGAVNVRGQLVSVIEPARALGLSTAQENPSPGETSNILLLESRFGRVGLLLQSTPELLRLEAPDMAPPLPGQTGIRALLTGRIALLDIDALLEGRNL
jgi:purine-binding chemotaxis protein CheW